MADYIPPELIPNILARLPVEDVLRCTSVCKSWYSLITCPSFASSHLNLSNQEPRVLVGYIKPENKMSSRYCLHRDNQTFDEIAELDDPISFRGNEWNIAGSLNGLVCLYHYRKGTIVLWNPSLRKSFILPNSRVLSDSHVSYSHTIGFGFVATSNDYKIVKFSHVYRCEPQAEIYQLSTGSWRDLKLEKSVHFYVKNERAHLNGILHWSARNQGEVNPSFTYFICSFDLKNEKFGTLMLPSCLRHDDDIHNVDEFTDSDLCTFKESLCLIEYGRDKLCTVWIMKEYGVADSWERLFYINKDIEDHNLEDLLYFKHNGEILFECSCKRFGEQELITYDFKNNRIKNVAVLGNILCLRTYVESLVLIKGPNEVKIDEEPTNMSKNI